MAGFGRTGRWFAFENYDVVPDLVTFAKGVNSGYVPLGGVIINAAIAASFDDRVYPGGLTYSGHPLACAAAVATIETMRDEQIVENSARLGLEVYGPTLAKIADTHPSVGEVRGLGSFWALELVKDPASREPLAPYGGTSDAMNATVAACRSEGMLPFVNYNRIHVVPPLNISDDDAHRGLETLDRALSVADTYVS
jgi:taurine--2-oxoglutarate transaminase